MPGIRTSASSKSHPPDPLLYARRCRLMAATRSGPTCTWPMRRCRMACGACWTASTRSIPANPTARRRRCAIQRLALDRDHARRSRGRPRDRASGRAHASGERPQGAVRQRDLHDAFRGNDRGREPPAPQIPIRARNAAGIHLPLPLDGQGRWRSGTTAARCTTR